ncbi:hypothetical protein P168DRAFT_289103 [Aspergillus campestris IBT 28561]|uniref:DUF7137 domain-containing protein n=1 Tax=Aspergillus campestris (strain IBT 28561) TaxID=1392248 RepID=A0A2I1D6Y0_ASPC2|nr:uncharacterized protein P168DRAFT_289103 [Aspergillus campestris IBT 28561]PKY05650.1 hypothetical protein P168DRAFT_289103 [Aspergillus campestris IBT 28561]
MRSFAFLSLLCFLFVIGIVSASSGPGAEVLYARAEETGADKAEAEATPTADQPKETGSNKDDESTSSADKTDKDATATDSEKSTATDKDDKPTPTDKDDKDDKPSKTDKDKKPKSTSVDPRLPAGGVSMLTPDNRATTYYKVGDHVTFVWNYTSLSVTPSAVNVVASCSLNSATYTISGNMSVEETGKVVWDTKKYQANATVPLLTATYTLFVYDIDGEPGDTAKAGHLGSQIGYNFGMYLPQSYTPINEHVCATCNGALSDTERTALKFAVGMAAITITTFTWFAGDFGVFAT